MGKQFSEETQLTRFENFIDAILAIIITILVLEFKVPDKEYSSTGELKSAVNRLLPSVFSYVITFATIAGLWMDHHHLIRQIKKADTTFVILNFLFILFLSATPFTTALAGRNHENSYAVSLVAINYSLMSFSFMIIWAYCAAKKLLSESFINSPSSRRDTIIAVGGLVLLLASIPLAYVSTYISSALFIVVVTAHFIKQFFH